VTSKQAPGNITHNDPPTHYPTIGYQPGSNLEDPQATREQPGNHRAATRKQRSSNGGGLGKSTRASGNKAAQATANETATTPT
jgi:hypothetical protein